MTKFMKWMNNVAIQRKFIPLQCFLIVVVCIISLFSFFSVRTLNDSAEQIIEDSVRNKEQLSGIIRNMYVCRVLGRDILFAVDEDVKDEYYEEYIQAFNDLDYKMDEFAKVLEGTQRIEFERIIEEKNVYKDSMILSADIWMGGGEYDEALHALQVVTPIANDFFGSIDEFTLEEERLMNETLERNDTLVSTIMVLGTVIDIVAIIAILLFIRFFARNMSSSLITLEKSLSKIAETGNMKIEIPDELYTQDEVGRIASVANKMKTMLLDYSFNDTLTGGYNVKAYHEELNELFANEAVETEVWCVISDMNNLKLINDMLGHMEGDEAIRNAYLALDQCFSIYGKTFRIGGDEFVSLLSGCAAEDIEAAMKNISKKIEKYNTYDEYRFSLAIGYGYFKGKTILEYNEFFKTVDQKMYNNKLAGKQSRMEARVEEAEVQKEVRKN